MKRKVSIIGTNGLPANYGGFETLTKYLVRDLSDFFDITVYCSNIHKKKYSVYGNAKLVYLPLSANGLQGVIYDVLSIVHSLFTQEILLVLGSSGTIALPLNKIFKRHIVFNFGGLDWQREKWGLFAKWFLKYSEGVGVRFSNYTIVDNEVFAAYVFNTYKKHSFLVEYGGDHVSYNPNNDYLTKHNLKNGKYFLSISRAQEDNNIHLLIDYFKDIKDKKLVIISNWKTSDYGINLKNKFGMLENIILIDAIYDQEELDSIRKSCYCYIHTHSACGSAPSLIEAMCLNLPIISFDVPANRATTENSALYFSSKNEFINIMNGLLDEQIDNLRQKSKDIAEKRYKWKIISEKYKELLNVQN